MVKFSNTYRSNESEIMDDFGLQGTEMKTLLTDLRIVNKWLGGTNITIQGIEKVLSISNQTKITILDVGCGDGEMLRECANYALQNGLNFNLIGIDANSFIIEEAKKRSKSFNNITFHNVDVFKLDETKIEYDIALCTLFLHHFDNEKIISLLNVLLDKAKMGVIINDLQRSRIAFNLFKFFSLLFLKTNIAKHDGLVSVARGFKRKELEDLSSKIIKSKSFISLKWAFRYQWILKKNI